MGRCYCDSGWLMRVGWRDGPSWGGEALALFWLIFYRYCEREWVVSRLAAVKLSEKRDGYYSSISFYLCI